MESLYIRDLGPIKDVFLEDIKPLTVIIGQSGSGKSTLMKVLALTRWIYKMLNIRVYLQTAGVKESPFKFNIKRYLSDDGILDYLHENTLIVYTHNEASFEIKGVRAEFRQLSQVSYENLCLEKISFITEKRNVLSDLLALTMKEKTAPFYLKELLNEYQTAIKYIKALDLEAVGVKLEIKKVNGVEYSYISGHDAGHEYSVKLEDASSGIQSMAPLNLIVHYYAHFFNLVESFNKAVFRYVMEGDSLKDFHPAQNVGDIPRKRVDIHIEEPEVCLYPDNQLRLMNQLVRECWNTNRDYDISLMITTHSPYLLNQLNLLFKAYDMGTDIEGAKMNYDQTDVYAVENGTLLNLKVDNAHLVNPEFLSAPVDHIYAQYEELSKLTQDENQ
jgi:predicted ATPase